MTKKYELIENDSTTMGGFSKTGNPNTVFRIKALKDFSNVKKGDLGGYIESEMNLSHEGNCWVYDDSKLFENAKLSGDAIMKNFAWVYNNADISGNIIIDGGRILDDTKMSTS